MNRLFQDLYQKFGTNFFLASFVTLLCALIYSLYAINECKERSTIREKEFSETLQKMNEKEIQYLKIQKNRIDSIYYFEKSKK